MCVCVCVCAFAVSYTDHAFLLPLPYFECSEALEAFVENALTKLSSALVGEISGVPAKKDGDSVRK